MLACRKNVHKRRHAGSLQSLTNVVSRHTRCEVVSSQLPASGQPSWPSFTAVVNLPMQRKRISTCEHLITTATSFRLNEKQQFTAPLTKIGKSKRRVHTSLNRRIAILQLCQKLTCEKLRRIQILPLRDAPRETGSIQAGRRGFSVSSFAAKTRTNKPRASR